ncbi:MAG: hypothetical protein ACE5HJ_05935 [Thermoplasmata archaeon]
MEPLTVRYDKLKEYINASGMYKMYEEGEEIKLIFEPTFVEASFHGSGSRIFISGRREGDRVTIYKFEIEDAEGEMRELDLEAARESLAVWLESVED